MNCLIIKSLLNNDSKSVYLRIINIAVFFLLGVGIFSCQMKVKESDMEFPRENWEQQLSDSQEVNSEKLEEALQFLEAQSGEHGIDRVVVVRNGYLIWKGNESKIKVVVASVSKVFTSSSFII